jgi:hypothetical protein
MDFALGQRLLQFSHARFGDFGVTQPKRFKPLQFGHLLEACVCYWDETQGKRFKLLELRQFRY